MRALSVVASLVVVSCAPVELGRPIDASAPDDAGPPADASADASSGSDVLERDGGGDAPASVDDAMVSAATLPGLHRCGAGTMLSVAFENTGTSAWSPGEVALVAVDGSDPLTSVTRHDLGAPVAPGGVASFEITGTATSTPGAYETDWRMARGATPFGATAGAPVAVNCPGTDSIDLGAAVLHASPAGVASWPITAEITALDIAPTGGVGGGGIVPDFTRRDGPMRWPDVPFLGGTDTIYYTLWFALRIDGVWHAAGAQQYWYEPGLRMCGIPSGWTSNLFYDVGRWGEMSAYPIAPGEIIGVLVAAGDHRSRTDTDGSTVLERSAVVLFPFPGDVEIVESF